MSDLRDLLSKLATEVEIKMRRQLETLVQGSIVRSQLPQKWNFKTEKESIIFSIDKKGATSVEVGEATDPDVTIEWKHDLLLSVVEHRSLEGIPAGAEPNVNVSTRKGKIGYTMIRKSLGF